MFNQCVVIAQLLCPFKITIDTPYPIIKIAQSAHRNNIVFIGRHNGEVLSESQVIDYLSFAGEFLDRLILDCSCGDIQFRIRITPHHTDNNMTTVKLQPVGSIFSFVEYDPPLPDLSTYLELLVMLTDGIPLKKCGCQLIDSLDS